MLPGMPNIVALELDAGGPFLKVWSDPDGIIAPHVATELELICKAAWQLLARCEELALGCISPEMSDMMFPQHEVTPSSFRLKRLRLDCGDSDDTAVLGLLMPYGARLEQLVVNYHGECLDMDIAALPPAYHFPSLRHLTILARSLRGNDAFQLRLADACAATLRTLSIEVVDLRQDVAADFSPEFARRYPSLRTLHLRFDDTIARWAIPSIVGSILQSRFPVLHTLSMEGVPLVDLADLPTDSALRRGGFKRIRDDSAANAASAPLLVGYCRPTSASFDTRLIELTAHILGTDTTGATRHFVEQDEADLLGNGPLSRRLDETVDWLARRIKHMRIVGDATALARLAEGLEGVATERWMIEM